MDNFKLFIGYLGSGATVANSAVYENGDYKKVAHISEAGRITLYVEESYIPTGAMERIKETARKHEQKTRDRLRAELGWPVGYSRTLDEICDHTSYNTWRGLLDALQGKTEDERRELITECYMSNF